MKSDMTLTRGPRNMIDRIKTARARRGEKERFSDLIGRLARFDKASGSSRLDLLSLPGAMQMVLRLFPRRYCVDAAIVQGTLRAFVSTVIPGSGEQEENLVRMYEDSYYPFYPYRGYLVYDINRRSRRLFNGREFLRLSRDERTRVIQHALAGREVARRLYKGAILMAQVSYYGAIYDEERGCPLIDFPGRNQGYSREQTTYPFAAQYFDRELSPDGHPW